MRVLTPYRLPPASLLQPGCRFGRPARRRRLPSNPAPRAPHASLPRPLMPPTASSRTRRTVGAAGALRSCLAGLMPSSPFDWRDVPTPPRSNPHAPLHLPSLPAVLPANTLLGGPQLPEHMQGGKKQAPGRRPLSDVTGHYAAVSGKGSICIGAVGGGFGMPMGGSSSPTEHSIAPAAASCRQEAAQARAAAHKRLALRSMR